MNLSFCLVFVFKELKIYKDYAINSMIDKWSHFHTQESLNKVKVIQYRLQNV